MSILHIIEKSRKKRENRLRRKVLAGIVLGAAAGLAAGILLAPKSGKETRQDFSEAISRLPDKLKEAGKLGSEKLKQVKLQLQKGQQSALSEVAASQELEYEK